MREDEKGQQKSAARQGKKFRQKAHVIPFDELLRDLAPKLMTQTRLRLLIQSQLALTNLPFIRSSFQFDQVQHICINSADNPATFTNVKTTLKSCSGTCCTMFTDDEISRLEAAAKAAAEAAANARNPKEN